MTENGVSFVEWMEEFVSQERGSRVVHYLLKDAEGNSVLAVIGTERSLRHMVYVVADEFLSYAGEDSLIQAGYKWRSRREVVDWLTSMLAKQQTDSAGILTRSFGLSAQHFSVADKTDHRVRSMKDSYSDIVWLGVSWTCGKHLKHFPEFCRNGTTIGVQSFVFVMAKEENRYVAYLEDMYEDKKGQKKVKVRWFHHSHEVKGVVRLRNSHPKEVYITPHTQVISVECVDGPAIVLTREHFEKCVATFPDKLLGKVHLCVRQFRSNKIKPFVVSKLKGYFDQPLVSCLDSDTSLNLDSGIKVLKKVDLRGQGIKRTRNSGEEECFLMSYDGLEEFQQRKLMRGYSSMFGRKTMLSKNGNFLRRHTELFKIDDKVELLCQDSGIRGCWFRCSVLEISRKQMKLGYHDLEDQDGCGNLEEWVPSFRLALPDKLGMRRIGRPTIRPCPPISSTLDIKFEVGDPVDAWWSDGWWEGVITAVNTGENDTLQVYSPGENVFLDVLKEEIRISKDWVDGKWIDVEANSDILSVIAKGPTRATVEKDEDANNSPRKIKVDGNENKEAVFATAPVSSSVKDDFHDDHRVNEKCNDDAIDNVDDKNVGMDEEDEKEKNPGGEEMKISNPSEDDSRFRNENIGTSEGGEREETLGDEEKKSLVPSENGEKKENLVPEAMKPPVSTEVTETVEMNEGKSGEEDKEASTPNDELVTVKRDILCREEN